MDKLIAFLVALREELTQMRQCLAWERIIAEKELFIGKYRDKEVLLMQTGMGREGAEKATKFALDRFPVTHLISLGFGGALVPELKAGDIILCHTLYCQEGKPCYSEADLLSTLNSLKGFSFRLFWGSSITMPRPVREPGEKQRLGKSFPAQVVDMESYWIGLIASAQGVPFLSVRAISDTLEDSLPPFIDSHSHLWGKAILYCLTNPGGLRVLWRLKRNASIAAQSLGEFMKAFLEAI